MRSFEDVDMEVWKQAREIVINMRGSDDVPAFDYCVEAEYNILIREKKARQIYIQDE